MRNAYILDGGELTRGRTRVQIKIISWYGCRERRIHILTKTMQHVLKVIGMLGDSPHPIFTVMFAANSNQVLNTTRLRTQGRALGRTACIKCKSNSSAVRTAYGITYFITIHAVLPKCLSRSNTKYYSFRQMLKHENVAKSI